MSPGNASCGRGASALRRATAAMGTASTAACGVQRRKSHAEVVGMLWPEGWELGLLPSLFLSLQLSSGALFSVFLLQPP